MISTKEQKTTLWKKKTNYVRLMKFLLRLLINKLKFKTKQQQTTLIFILMLIFFIFFIVHFYKFSIQIKKLIRQSVNLNYIYQVLQIYSFHFKYLIYFQFQMGADGSKDASKQPPATKTQTKPDLEQDKKIKIEGVVRNLDAQIKSFEDKQKKFQVKIDSLKKQAKQLLQNDKKVEAKKYLQTATKLKKQSQAFALRRKAIQGKKFQLQQASMDMQTVNALNGAQQHLKDADKYNEKLQEIILDTQQQKAVQAQMNDKLKGLVQDDQDMQDIDDMMAELQKEVSKQKKGKIQQKNVNTNVQTNTQKNTQKNTNKHNEDDQISKMMAQL